MALARTGLSLRQTLTGASSSVQTFAMIVAGAPALSITMALLGMAHVALTQVVIAISGETETVTRQAQNGTAVLKLQHCTDKVALT